MKFGLNMELRSILLLAAACLPFSAANAQERPAKPNIVLLLTDDLGWQDVKCYDIDEPSPMETPNVNALAKKGVMFWQAYSPTPDDPYRLDANGYPFDETNEDALTFLKENSDKPFFLYYATWLVHAPIQTRRRSRAA